MKLKLKDIPHQTQMEIYNNFHSGKFYIKELCEKYNITAKTFHEVIENIDLLKEQLLNAK